MKTIVCVFKNPHTGKERAYKITVDPKVYHFDWTAYYRNLEAIAGYMIGGDT